MTRTGYSSLFWRKSGIYTPIHQTHHQVLVWRSLVAAEVCKRLFSFSILPSHENHSMILYLCIYCTLVLVFSLVSWILKGIEYLWIVTCIHVSNCINGLDCSWLDFSFAPYKWSLPFKIYWFYFVVDTLPSWDDGYYVKCRWQNFCWSSIYSRYLKLINLWRIERQSFQKCGGKVLLSLHSLPQGVLLSWRQVIYNISRLLPLLYRSHNCM